MGHLARMQTLPTYLIHYYVDTQRDWLHKGLVKIDKEMTVGAGQSLKMAQVSRLYAVSAIKIIFLSAW